MVEIEVRVDVCLERWSAEGGGGVDGGVGGIHRVGFQQARIDAVAVAGMLTVCSGRCERAGGCRRDLLHHWTSSRLTRDDQVSAERAELGTQGKLGVRWR